jgi:GTP cyclohydrolase II
MRFEAVRKNACSALSGEQALVGVSRGIAEIRAGRPVLITANDESIIALPVEGLNADRLAAFASLCAPALPGLIITAPRARSLGIETTAPRALQLSPSCDVRAILTLVTDARIERLPRSTPAGSAAAAALRLVKLSQVLPAVLAADARTIDAAAFDPPIVAVTAEAIVRFRNAALRNLTIASEARVPLNSGTRSRVVAFRDAVGESSVAVIVGDPDYARPVPVRLHSACLTGDVFGSRRCDCGDQLKIALARLEAAGGGIIIYLAQEGRGVGLANKLRAYELQDQGLDTVDANTTLGFCDDERDYGVAGRMLQMLGCTRVILLTNNPTKARGLADAGIEISGCLPLEAPVNSENRRYLTAKAVRAGHRLDHVIEALCDSADGYPSGPPPQRGVV